jgi:hypothetical protein
VLVPGDNQRMGSAPDLQWEQPVRIRQMLTHM